MSTDQKSQLLKANGFLNWEALTKSPQVKLEEFKEKLSSKRKEFIEMGVRVVHENGIETRYSGTYVITQPIGNRDVKRISWAEPSVMRWLKPEKKKSKFSI